MMSRSFLVAILLLAAPLSATTCGGRPRQEESAPKPKTLSLIPTPRNIRWDSGRIPVAIGDRRSYLVLPKKPAPAIRHAAAVLNDTVKAMSGQTLLMSEPSDDVRTRIILELIEENTRSIKPDGYLIQMINKGDRWDVHLAGMTARGTLYAAMTLIQLLFKDGQDLYLSEAEVTDWPSFAVRDFCRDGYDAMPDARALAEWAVRYKINVVGISHFWPWRKVPDEFWKSAEEICRLARETEAFDVMFYCNPYNGYHKEKQINLLDADDMDHFLKHIRKALDMGASKVMLCVDDFTVWDRFTAAERRKFSDLAEAQVYLMNNVYKDIRKTHPEVEFFFCPAGPKGGYAGVPREGSEQERTLQALAEGLPEDVPIVWTGPEVRSRKISAKQLEQWSRAAKGRKPFLWDNTIYAHYQPTFVDLFLNPFKNDFPADLPDRLARGMHINGPRGDSERVKVSLLTAADYLWNAEAYDPEESIRRAAVIVAGPDAADPLLKFRDAALKAIRAHKRRKRDAEELKKTAEETFDKFTAVTANKKLAQDLDAFLKSHTR